MQLEFQLEEFLFQLQRLIEIQLDEIDVKKIKCRR